MQVRCAVRLSVVPCLVFFLLLVASVMSARAGETASFHVAATPAEKSLDAVLRLSEKDSNLVAFVLQTPHAKDRVGTSYTRYFTRRLLDDLAAREKKLVQEECQGKYLDGMVCGMDYNPLTCSQDLDDKPYQYKTGSTADGKTVIWYKWSSEKKPAARFEMLEEAGRWKIDGVKCP